MVKNVTSKSCNKWGRMEKWFSREPGVKKSVREVRQDELGLAATWGEWKIRIPVHEFPMFRTVTS